jgi:D-alanyl-lipoteichoic acid acyltransferase DltB (MBOAT superfamily)
MTLSRFLRDYVYFAFGGSRHGVPRRYVNLLATMLIGGLWHGAGWTFIAWGALHGIYLVINHAWNAIKQVLAIGQSSSRSLWCARRAPIHVRSGSLRMGPVSIA